MKLLRDSLFVAGHDLLVRMKYPETKLWAFGMPIVFMFFIGITFSDSYEPKPGFALELEVAPNAGILAEAIGLRLSDAGIDVTRTQPSTSSPAAEAEVARLVIPENFTQSVEAGEPPPLVFWRAQEAGMTLYQEFRVRRAARSAIGDWMIAKLGLAEGMPEEDEASQAARLAAARALPRSIELDVTVAGRRAKTPTGFQQSVPGTMVWFLMQGLLTIGGTSLLALRGSGLIARLATTQLDRRAIVWGQWASSLGLATLQILWMMGVGRWLFGVDWGSHLVAVWLVLLAWAGCLSAVAILLGSLLRTQAQVIGIGVLTGILLACLGGCAWPIEIASPSLQRLAMLLPTGWTIDALHKLVTFGDPPASVAPHFLALTLLAAVLLRFATQRFRLLA